jgi:N-acyl homoserine lactone hydrolase
MTAAVLITITPVFVADLLAEGERMPVYVHVIDHPIRACWSTPELRRCTRRMADLDPCLRALSEQEIDLAGIDIVVNIHLHADYCGGNSSSLALLLFPWVR